MTGDRTGLSGSIGPGERCAVVRLTTDRVTKCPEPSIVRRLTNQSRCRARRCQGIALGGRSSALINVNENLTMENL